MRVQDDEKLGMQYVDECMSCLSPMFRAPVPEELVAFVTVYDEAITGDAIKPQGIYAEDGVELVARNRWESTKGDDHLVQRVSIKGSSVSAVQDYFRRFMRGELTPSEPWEEDDIRAKVAAEAPAQESEVADM